MKRSKFSPQQKQSILKEASASSGVSVAKKYGISVYTLYAWKKESSQKPQKAPARDENVKDQFRGLFSVYQKQESEIEHLKKIIQRYRSIAQQSILSLRDLEK